MRGHLRILVWASAALAVAGLHTVQAQGWGGWGDNYNRGYDQPGDYSQPPVYGEGAPRPAYGSANPRCRELEFQLTGGSPNLAGQDQLQRIEADMREADSRFRRVQSEADGANCYEDMFFFGRSLRRTPRCIDLDQQIQQAKSTLAQLKAQRDAAQRSISPRGRHDDLIAELARNRCGVQYEREYEAQRSRSTSIFSFFSDDDSDNSGRYTPSYGASTYRTLCVRECDGFYFPISTATTQSQFRDDENKCRAQCAAPAQLFYQPSDRFYNPSDQDVDQVNQMVSLSGKPYKEIPNASRYQKVYIRGCSCNAREYSREEIAKSEEALKTGKRADASGGKSTPSTPVSAFERRISQTIQNAPSQPPQSPPAQTAPSATSAPGAPAATPEAAQPPATPAR